jgi:hypothetical protein
MTAREVVAERRVVRSTAARAGQSRMELRFRKRDDARWTDPADAVIRPIRTLFGCAKTGAYAVARQIFSFYAIYCSRFQDQGLRTCTRSQNPSDSEREIARPPIAVLGWTTANLRALAKERQSTIGVPQPARRDVFQRRRLPVREC